VLVAVGQHEEPLASVRRSHVGRSKTRPFRIEPALGKLGKDVGEPKRNVSRDVLEEHERGFALVDDSSHVRPEMPLVGVAATLAGDAERLTGIPCSDEIHDSAPRLAVEGREIVPDRSAIQGRVFHPRHEHGRGEGFPLDEANGAAPLGQSEIDSADAGAQADGT
jgi:hypothetical protein